MISRVTSRSASTGASGVPSSTCWPRSPAARVPHHCFHVFAVYPWLGLLRSGIVEQPLHILDQCRTTPALVQSCHEDGSLTVLARPLRWQRGRAVAR